MASALIAVDWGTTSCRAALLDEGGAILDRRGEAPGILHVPRGDFAEALDRLIQDWPDVPVVLSGMIGSRQGWVEAPYVRTPIDLDGLGRELVAVPASRRAPVRLVPGVMHDGAWPDVMRGEETQIVGVLGRLAGSDGTIVLPGTHSKHAVVSGDRIVAFKSFMTGEVFAALSGHTILARLMQPAPSFDAAAFDRGVVMGAEAGTPGALLSRVFSTRTLGLFDRLAPAAAGDYLSGLLIGAEVSALGGRARPVLLVGSGDLTRRYEAACRSLGIATDIAPPDAAAHGAFALAQRAALRA
jgi:2-dehydro-3-deoxygalactonokinase